MLRLLNYHTMAQLRPTILAGTGNVIWNTRFSNEATMLITGNVTLFVQGLDNGYRVVLLVTQDSVGSHTLTIVPIAGTSNQVTSGTSSINTTANAYTQISIMNVRNRLTLNYLDPASDSGGTGPAGRSIQVFTSLPSGSFGTNYFAGDIVML
jgi:hypothetical protein